MIYGYCRISTPKQKIERQIRNILNVYPDAFIVKEAYTGTKIVRDEFAKLLKKVEAGDTIVFDEVSRMARNEEEGYELWMELFKKDIQLVFLKEQHISTSVYAQRLDSCKMQLTGTSVDIILQAVEQFLFELAKEQIRLAFHQAQKEVDFLHQRTKEGIQTAKLNGKHVGRVAGKVYMTKKAAESKAIIMKHNKDFGGSLNDRETMALCGVRPNAFYKYKKQLKENNV